MPETLSYSVPSRKRIGVATIFTLIFAAPVALIEFFVCHDMKQFSYLAKGHYDDGFIWVLAFPCLILASIFCFWSFLFSEIKPLLARTALIVIVVEWLFILFYLTVPGNGYVGPG